MSQADKTSSAVDASSFESVVGVASGSQTCSFCVYKPNNSQVIKPSEFATAMAGFGLRDEK